MYIYVYHTYIYVHFGPHIRPMRLCWSPYHTQRRCFVQRIPQHHYSNLKIQNSPIRETIATSTHCAGTHAWEL